MRLLGALIISAIVVGWASASSSQARPADALTDVSWPNCTLQQPPFANEGIIGVNGGLALRPNPCLAKQTSWFKKFSVYVNTGYPGPKLAQKFQHSPKNCSVNDEKCLAYNYGYNSGLYDIKYASMHGVIADRWWLDVETENSWSDNPQINRLALTGMIDVLGRYAGQSKLGIYSYPGQWDSISGHWHNFLPAWVATGSSKPEDAKNACRPPSFTDGPIFMTQFTTDLDHSYLCP